MAYLAIATTLQIKTTECIKCGCVIGLSQQYYDERLADHQLFHCPNGHTQYFSGESVVEKANRLLREEQARHQRTISRINEVERERDRLKKRVKAGVCPCCKRTFRSLALHMKHKHPDYAKKK
jgi:Zn ribbon nucleic-acid-binding protein